MKKKSLRKIALNKSTVSIINGRFVNGGLASNHANYGNYSDVHSDLVSLPVATNCPTDTFELSCICSNGVDTSTPIDKEPASPVRNR
ncbi:hypothetical protein [Kordia jejudonensis]|uniref:hypothetical protein n=1 Tax=Kordia jejudonensis TaxID=1348245 RepID=UPI00062911C4|nr:hypothetical protein [Kordia jejudonensis]